MFGGRRVAPAYNQPFQVITAGEEFLARFPYYAERAVYLAEGCADVSRAPDVYLNEKAREIAPVRMTGNLGGEILRQCSHVQARGAAAGLFRSRYSLSHPRSSANLWNAGSAATSSLCRLQTEPLESLRDTGAGTVATLAADPFLGQRFDSHSCFGRPRPLLLSVGFVRLVADGEKRTSADPDRPWSRWRARANFTRSPPKYPGIPI